MDIETINELPIGKREYVYEDFEKIVLLVEAGSFIEPLFRLPKNHPNAPPFCRTTFYNYLPRFPDLKKRLEVATHHKTEILQSAAIKLAEKLYSESREAWTKLQKPSMRNPKNDKTQELVNLLRPLAEKLDARAKVLIDAQLKVATQLTTASARSIGGIAANAQKTDEQKLSSIGNVLRSANAKKLQ